MNILRKLGVGLCATLLSLGLFGTAWSNVGISTIRDRNTVKEWLDESGFYTRIADVALEKIKTGNADKNNPGDPSSSKEENLPIEDPQVQAVAKSALSPEFLKTNVEKLLDSGYNWLDGTTDNLSFSIDLSPAKQQLAIGIGNYATTKAAALPVCATNESASSFDAFSSICRPRGLSAEAAGQEVTNKLANGDEFLAKPVLTASDLKIKDDNGKEVPVDQTKQADAVRKSYRLSGFAPLLFGTLALVSAIGVIFLSKDRLAGIRRAGVILLVTGLILLATYIGLGAASSLAVEKLGQNPEAGAVAQNKLAADMIKIVLDSVKNALVLYTASYIGLGLLAIIGSMIMKKRRGGDKKPVENEEKEAEKTDEPAQNEKPTETGEPKAEKKPPKKIQL